MRTKKPSTNARRKARRLALQAVYQWQLSRNPAGEIEQQFLENSPLTHVDVPYFLEIFRSIPKNREQIDQTMIPVLDRPITDLNPVELAILRIAICELMFQPEVPYRVVLDEALRLAKTFGAVEGYKYINAILDEIVRSIRTLEPSRPKRGIKK